VVRQSGIRVVDIVLIRFPRSGYAPVVLFRHGMNPCDLKCPVIRSPISRISPAAQMPTNKAITRRPEPHGLTTLHGGAMSVRWACCWPRGQSGSKTRRGRAWQLPGRRRTLGRSVLLSELSPPYSVTLAANPHQSSNVLVPFGAASCFACCQPSGTLADLLRGR
jgi:hypothetical protein